MSVIDQIAAAIGADRILTGKDAAPYGKDWTGAYTSTPVAVLRPMSTAEVAAIMQIAHATRTPVVPCSGRTGLTGATMADGALMLSVERLNQIAAINATGRTATVGAGVVLSHLHDAAAAHDLIFPLTLGARGSAMIGGLLSTNAGGSNVVRYGSTRGLCLGLEVVMADGRVMNLMSALHKDNSGLDLRNLVIGAEGTLGIITAAALRLVPRPVHLGAALLAVPSPQAALDLLAMAGAQIGDGLSAFELMHRQGFDFLAEVGPDVRQPLDAVPEWSVLIDLGLPASGDPDAALERLFADAFEAGLALDGVVAQSAAQRQALWAIRENIPEANRRIGSIASHDVALPLSAVPDFIEMAGAALWALGDMRVNCFGHLGDGNLHYNVFPANGRVRGDYDVLRPAIQRTIHDLVAALDGSVSAEHGIGRVKVADLERYADPVKLSMMRAVKAALDPAGILNPGAVLRAG